jgi:hypothetical protein
MPPSSAPGFPAGEALHSAREPIDVLEQLRDSLGEYHFSGQYQQSPAPRGGGMVKEAWLQYYEPYELPPKFDRIVQSWDTANKETELSDYSVCTTWGCCRRRCICWMSAAAAGFSGIETHRHGAVGQVFSKCDFD